MKITGWRWIPCWRCAASRAESVRGQLEGQYPITLAQQADHPNAGVDASHVDLRALGDFQDLENAKARQDAALAAVR